MTKTLKCYKESWWILVYRLHDKRALWKILSHRTVKKKKKEKKKIRALKLFILLIAAEYLQQLGNGAEASQFLTDQISVTLGTQHFTCGNPKSQPHPWGGAGNGGGCELWDSCTKATGGDPWYSEHFINELLIRNFQAFYTHWPVHNSALRGITSQIHCFLSLLFSTYCFLSSLGSSTDRTALAI